MLIKIFAHINPFQMKRNFVANSLGDSENANLHFILKEGEIL